VRLKSQKNTEAGASMMKKTPHVNSVTAAPFDPIRWALANPWLSEGQADDRIPMNGSVAPSGGTASAQRAFARRSHQVAFKKWAQARHD
jgi:hypothetical protein